MKLKKLLATPSWEWPENAGKSLLAVLENSTAEPSERLLAAELAGDLVAMNDELAEGLLAIVRRANEPEQLRAQVAISLGPVLEQVDIEGFDDPDLDDVPISEPTFQSIQDTLRKLYLEQNVPKDVRRRILEASVRAPQDWHRQAIQEAYDSGDPDWILTAVFAMDYIRGFDRLIVEALKNEDPKIHYNAVKAAGAWGTEEAWAHVLGLINAPDTEKPVLLAAISAVGTIRPPRGT